MLKFVDQESHRKERKRRRDATEQINRAVQVILDDAKHERLQVCIFIRRGRPLHIMGLIPLETEVTHGLSDHDSLVLLGTDRRFYTHDERARQLRELRITNPSHIDNIEFDTLFEELIEKSHLGPLLPIAS